MLNKIESTLHTLCIVLLCAWLGMAQAVAGSLTLLGVGGPAAGTTNGPAFVASVPNTNFPATAAVTFSVPMGTITGTPLLVVFFSVTASRTISSIVFDPTGQNVTLTQDVLENTSNTGAIYSSQISATSGSKNIVVTMSSAAQFQGGGVFVWVINGQSSNTVITTGHSSTASMTISATAGKYMIAGALAQGVSGYNWSTSTQAPTVTSVDSSTENAGAYWNPLNTTGSYTLIPAPGHANAQCAATYF